MEEVGHSFPVLDPQDFSGHAEVRYGGEWCIFPSLAPQVLSGPAIEERVRNNPGLTLQALPYPLEAKRGRWLSIFPSLTSQGLSCLERSAINDGAHFPWPGRPWSSYLWKRWCRFPFLDHQGLSGPAEASCGSQPALQDLFILREVCHGKRDIPSLAWQTI